MASNTDTSSDCESQCSSGPEEVLCDYEKKRLENIKKNQEMMKALGLPVNDVGKTGRPLITRSKARNSGMTQRAGRNHKKGKKKNKRRRSASENDSDWEPWMDVQTSRSTCKTKLPRLSLAEFLEMQEVVDKEVDEVMKRGYVVGNKRHRRTSTQGAGRRSTRIRQGRLSLLEVTLPDMFSSDLSDKDEFKGFSVEDLELPKGCTSSQLCDANGSGGNDNVGNGECLFPKTLDDEAEFTGFMEENVLTTEVPNCSTRRSSRLATANNKQYEEDVLSDEDEYLFCDDCNDLYHGECPVHGPLAELDPTAGYDKASLAYTQLPVPEQLTVRPSVIPGAGLGVFAVSLINKGVRVGPYEGRKVAREDMGDLHNTAYAWEIRHEGVDPYFIDGQDSSHSNWMRFVNCARNEDEQNILAYQYHGSIYYRTFETIYPKSELLIWYGEQYAKELGIHPNTDACTANFCCRGCGGSFSEETSFYIHLKYSSICARTHPQTFTCLMCHQHFTQLECLQQHIRKHEDLAQDKQCSYCEKSFNHRRDIQRHLRTHTGEKLYKCEYCGKSFNQRGSLQGHIRTHTGDKPYKCEYCGKSFSRSYSLQGHLRTHTGDKPYKCEYCEMSFNQRGNLQGHIRTHTGDKPYKCEYCEMSFNQRCDLQRHVRAHTGDKPYKCEYCGKSFNQRGSIQGHIRTHTGDKPYKCEYCGNSFSRSHSLQRHVRTHIGDKP